MRYEIKKNEINKIDYLNMYYQNGFLVVKNFFSKKLIEQINGKLAEVPLEKWKKDYGGKTAFLRNGVKNQNNYYGISYAQPITSYCNYATQLYGSELLIFAEKLLKKNDLFYRESELHVRHPNVSHKIPSHQDNFYFTLQNPRALTCYIFLTAQKRESGGLGFKPDKVNIKTFKHISSDTEGFSSFCPRIEKKLDSFYYPNTNPGDVIFHHCTTFHRADANITDKVSSAISVRIFSRSSMLISNEIRKSYLQNLIKNRR